MFLVVARMLADEIVRSDATFDRRLSKYTLLVWLLRIRGVAVMKMMKTVQEGS